MQVNGSSDITVLSVRATFDLSGALPLVSLVNLSQGPNLAGCTFWFVLTSPSGTLIHEGSLATPDANGAWAIFTISDAWPRPFNQLEWSGAPYNLTVYVQDSAGNQFVDDSYNATICRPSGNTDLSKNFYGISQTDVKVLCDQATIFFQDQTPSSYKGLVGEQVALVSSVLKLVYPPDDTGNIPAPFVMNNFSAASVPISYSSDNYQFQTQVVYDYDFGGNVHVRIRYQSYNSKKGVSFITFSVLCNIDMMPLICEFEKLVHSIETGSCVDVEDAQRRLNLINPLFALAIMGLMQPLTGIDVPEKIKEIQRIGGFNCDCFNAPTGIIPQTAGVIGGYTFSIVPQCGDISGTVSVNGTNVQILLSDKSYVFSINSAATTTAFTIIPSTTGCVKTYTFNVDLVQLSTDILNTIKGNPDLVNLFNSIVNGGGGSFLFVDGKCIFQSTSTFNYAFTLANIPLNTTNALLSSINKAGVIQVLNFAFNITNLAALQTYLNTLGMGVFTVTNPSGQTVLITSNANPNVLSALQYSLSGTMQVASQTTTAAGYVPISANQVVQNIINYLCGLTDAEIKTSQDYIITYIGSNGQPQEVTVAAGTTLAVFLATLTNLSNQTATNIGSNLEVSCASIKAAFPVVANPIVSGDYVLMAKGGVCAQGDLMDVFLFMLNTGISNATVKTAFCAFVESCGAGLSCAPYDYFDVIVTQFNSACAPIVGIEVTLS